MLERLRASSALLAVTAVAAFLPASAHAATHDEGLPNVDLRTAQPAPVPAPLRAERAELRQDLGSLAKVRTAPSGGVAYIGSPTTLLTEPSTKDPATIALDYVREHGEVFGLTKRDVANLQLVSRSTSPDGITHLRFNQVLDGVPSFDSGIEAHVTRDGRLINVSGAPLPNASLTSTDPALDALGGLGAARDATNGSGLPPSTADTADDDHDTTFSTGERALLRWTPGPDGRAHLAWQVVTDGGDGHLYDALVDARDGDLLRRQDLTHQLGAAKYFPADPDTTTATQITMPPAWYDENAGGTRLWGQYAHTYIDPTPASQNSPVGADLGGSHVQIPASGGAPAAPDWLYTQSTSFPGATPCPLTGCTWNSASTATKATNQFQAATNAHVLTSRYHDYLEQEPIGFDEWSGNFQRVNAENEDGDGDYVRVEVNDGEGYNNANFSTPVDGTPPRMQMYLWNTRDANGSDAADIVYHEYGHGLSNRLVVNVSGGSTLSSIQPRMMGEAWSDFYALDLLVHEGSRTDTAAAGELALATYMLGPAGIRSKPIDCPVAPAGLTGCNANFSGYPTVLGGFTYADIASTNNSSPHHGSEVWAQTLWDIRTALGREEALTLITGGMRISGENPSMLDMRDAILQMAVALRSAPNAPDDHYEELWGIFAARGMGAGATTAGPNATNPTESYALPTGIRALGTWLDDPYPGGDNDGIIEPGERFEVYQDVWGIGFHDLPGVTGTLTSTNPGLVVEEGTASWPLLGKGRSDYNLQPFVARMPASCTSTSPLTISISSTAGPATVSTTIDPRTGVTDVLRLNDATSTSAYGVTESKYRVVTTGAITDVDVRIDELRHSYLGDLRVELVHDGVTAVLFSQLGTSTGNYAGDDIVAAIIDSDAVATLPTSGPGPITGRLRPQVANALDAFDGHPASGDWTLKITDTFPSDSGELRRWGLDSPQVPACRRLEIPAAATGDAGGVDTTGATIGGSVTPNGRATGLRFAYGTTTAYGAATDVVDVGAGDVAQLRTAQLTGLAPGTTYHYRVESIREWGEVAVPGQDRTFTTAPLPTPEPTPPSGGGSTGPGGGGAAGGGSGTGGGSTPGAVDAPAVDRTAPTFAGKVAVKLSKGTVKGHKRPTFTFELSEVATVQVVLTKAAPGVKVGNTCVAPTRANRRKPKCTRQLPAGTASKAFPAGKREFALGAKGLPKGTYTARITATDAAKNVSAPKQVVFVVK